MDRNQLLETAKQLKQVSSETAAEYQQKSEQLIGKMNELMMQRPDLEKLIGKNNISMMKDNHANHVRFIASILKNYNPEVFVDTILWVFRAYRSHGFASNYFAAKLNGWVSIFKEVLSPESYKEVYSYYDWMQINIPIFVLLSDEKLNISNSLN